MHLCMCILCLSVCVCECEQESCMCMGVINFTFCVPNYIGYVQQLYNGGSDLDGGTLIQLRNLINRHNVAADISGRFNEATMIFLNCWSVATLLLLQCTILE